jgi:hypothetical protein
MAPPRRGRRGLVCAANAPAAVWITRNEQQTLRSAVRVFVFLILRCCMDSFLMVCVHYAFTSAISFSFLHFIFRLYMRMVALPAPERAPFFSASLRYRICLLLRHVLYVFSGLECTYKRHAARSTARLLILPVSFLVVPCSLLRAIVFY